LDERRVKNASGKLVILAIIAVAIAAAGTSWWFRYNATHRAAAFWGPETAALIRDASVVEVYYVNDDPNTVSLVRDISKTPGITHLRNALLEDRSYRWPAQKLARSPRWRWALAFNDAGQSGQVVLMLTDDFDQVVCMTDKQTVLNSAPIAAGLRKIFDEFEFSAGRDSNPTESSR
jgi:hypothetical protein